MCEELKSLSWIKAELERRRKDDKAKVAIARGLRVQIAVRPKWIAENLYMASFDSKL